MNEGYTFTEIEQMEEMDMEIRHFVINGLPFLKKPQGGF